MPIEVRHGEPDMVALAALAAMMGAGQQRAPEIPQFPIAGVSIPGGGGGGPRHERVPWHRRLWGGPVTRRAAPTPEEQLQYEGEKMQLQEKAEAEGWERKYSAKKRQDVAAIEKARQDLRVNPAFSEREKIMGDRALIAQSLGIEKDVIPPDPDKEIFEPGKGPKDTWPHEVTGDIMGYDRNGNQVVRVKYADTPDGRLEAHERLKEIEGLKQQAALEKERRDAEIKWASGKVPVTQEATEGGWLGIGAKEAGQVGERFRTDAEVRALSEKYFGPRPGEEVMEQPQPQAAEQRLTGPQELIRATHAMHERGVLIPKESDADLPHYVGMATAFLRKMKSESERGRDISPYAEAIQEARIILSQHAAREVQ